jgi:glutamate carboxypeptidase
MDKALTDRILPFVRQHVDEQLNFVIELCNENSYTANRDGTNRVASLILERVEGLFSCHETVPQTEVGDHHILRSRDTGKALYLLGHMDTVFPPDHPFQKCRYDRDWLVGPGTGDMKGGIAVVVYALKALAEAGLLDRLDVTLILSADEETGAATSRALFEKETPRATGCLVAECGGPNGEIVVSRNGKAGGRLECFGEQRHVGRGTEQKTSAIMELAHKIIAIESLNGCLPGVSVNAGIIEGGLGPCTIPGHATCLFDMRWVDDKHYADLRERLTRIVADAAQTGSRCEFTILNHRPAMPITEGSRMMLRKLRAVSQSLGTELRQEHRRGTSDANYFGNAGVPTLDGFGPICEDDHTVDERILISSLAARTSLLATFLAEFRH